MRRTALPALALLFACGGSKPAKTVPAAPQNLAATPGDGQVTLIWDAVDSALGYRVYSADGADASKTSTRAEVGAVTSWTVVGLANGHAFHFAVSAYGPAGEGALSAQVVATPKVDVPLAVASFTPADGAASVARNAKVVVHFNRPVQAQSATAGCAGSVRLSDDNFATCAAGTLAASTDLSTFTFTPAAPLREKATYKLRVTTDLKDVNGLPLAAPYTSAGFTTAATLAVVGIAPSGQVAQPRPDVVVTFNRPVAAASVVASGCAGTVAVKAGGACLPLTASVAGSVVTLALG